MARVERLSVVEVAVLEVGPQLDSDYYRIR